jgi:adenosyl cobinamide kinase/adenosyl cobinamide phosphate guanylyltransferase/NaMN:DMB phosphoribosyltransferase
MRVLVLGGIRSGKSTVAEALVSGAGGGVRYVATSAVREGDAEWSERIAEHRRRRPEDWSTEEIGTDPQRLTAVLAEAKPDETLLVDDLGGWLTALLDRGAAELAGTLAEAVRECQAARLVLVSPEVGLSVVPGNETARGFADRIGALNQATAAACDGVVLVVAGQPTWLKGRDTPQAPAVAVRKAPRPVGSGVRAAVGTPVTVRTDLADLRIEPPLDLPMPDEDAAEAAGERLATLDVPGMGLGALASVVRFAAGTQGTPVPQPWQAVRVLLLHADHDGPIGAGESPAQAARRLAQAERGEGPLALLAGAAGAELATVRWPDRAAPIEVEDAMTAEEVDAALRYGWQLADSAVDAGADLLVPAFCGAGAEAAAVAVTARVTGAEAAGLLGRVVGPGATIDDNAWMERCATIRDALHRIRVRDNDPRTVLAALGGPDLAMATGMLLGAVSRRTPVLLDGPSAVAAALVAREFGAQTRHWLLAPDHGGHPAVVKGTDVLGLPALADLRLGLGEGAGALAVLPVLASALTLAASLPERPIPEPPEPEPPKSDGTLSDVDDGRE